MNTTKLNHQSGFSMVEIMVGIGLLSLVAFAVFHLASVELSAQKDAKQRGEHEDLRRWIRYNFDCSQTVRREKHLCGATASNIQGFQASGNPMIAGRGTGRKFGPHTVTLNCQNTGVDLAVNAVVTTEGKSTALFEVPISCRLCGRGTTDPQTFSFLGNNAEELGRQVAAASAECGEPMPDYPIRRYFNGTGGGNRWNNNGVMDTATLTKVCNIFGFDNYVSSTCYDSERSGRYPGGKCQYHSPSNNYNQYFNGTSWVPVRGPDKYSWTWLASITCSGLQ